MVRDRPGARRMNERIVVLVGPDAVSPGHIKRLLAAPHRTAAERDLLLACYGVLGGRSRPEPMTETQRTGLLTALTERVTSFTGKAVPVGEQRLLVTLSEHALTRQPDHRPLRTALAAFADKAGKAGPLRASIRGWQEIRRLDDLPPSRLHLWAGLGHWDGETAYNAARALAKTACCDPEAILSLGDLLTDPRDRVRRNAVRVLVYANRALPPTVATQLMTALSDDPVPAVQAGAARVIGLRATEPTTTKALAVLIARVEDRKTSAEARRLTWGALQHFTTVADWHQTRRLARAAVRDLDVCPRPVLVTLDALGDAALLAIDAVKAFRARTTSPDLRRLADRILARAPTAGSRS